MLGLWRAGVNKINHTAPVDFIGWLGEAADVAVTEQINESWSLEFKYPQNGRYAKQLTSPFLVVECEGQKYVIDSITHEGGQLDTVKCTHIFFRDSKKIHVPNIGSTATDDTISIAPIELCAMIRRSEGCTLHIISNEDLPEGMTWIGTEPEFTIDFESVDKTTPFDVIKQIIENAGQGEIYSDNQGFAIVGRLGEDKNILISTANLAENVTVQRDYTDVVTRLYPYGKDDLTIANASKNDGKTPYIDSDMAYATVCQGYKDYSDIIDADKLWERGMWEFDEENPDRIDVPKISISGSLMSIYAASSRPFKIGLGDGVYVLDRGVKSYVRCISRTHYPYAPQLDSVQLGRVTKDAFFYLNQLGKLATRYKGVSTSSGKIQGKKVSGTVTATASASSAKVAAAVSTSGGISISGSKISVSGVTLTADAAGKLYINGKEVAVKEETAQ